MKSQDMCNIRNCRNVPTMTYLGARICDKHHTYLADKPEETILSMVVDKSIVNIQPPRALGNTRPPERTRDKKPQAKIELPPGAPDIKNKAFLSAWNKGKKAKQDGLKAENNPYGEGSIMAKNFRRYWLEGHNS